MGGLRVTYGGTGKVHTGCCCGDLKKIGHLVDLSVDGMIILK